jgi:hypothetical protein
MRKTRGGRAVGPRAGGADARGRRGGRGVVVEARPRCVPDEERRGRSRRDQRRREVDHIAQKTVA